MHSYARLRLIAVVAVSLAANASAILCQTPRSTGAQAQPDQALPAQMPAAPVQLTKIYPNDGRIQLIGRIDDRDPLQPRLAYPGTEIRLRLHGAKMRIAMLSDSDKSALTIVTDHGAPRLQLLHGGSNDVVINAVPAEGDHTIEIIKRTETWQGILTFESIGLPVGATLLPPPPRPVRKLMLVGDSVTCGAGVNNNAACKPDPEDPANDVYNSYGLLLGRRFDAETHLVCYGGRGLVRDYRGLGIADNVLNAPQFLTLSVPSDAALAVSSGMQAASNPT